MKTAEQILSTYHPITRDMELKTDLWPDQTVIMAMEEYANQYRDQPRPNEVSAEAPIWYDEMSINNHLQNLHIPEKYRNVLVKDLADCLQQAFKKGWEKGFNDIQKNGTWEYVYYQPENAMKQSSNVGDGWISKKGVLDLLETQRILELKHNNHSADYAERLLYDLIQEIETLPPPPKQ